MPNRLEKRDAFLASFKDGPSIMGILNVTPDSFSDGGQFDTLDTALRQADRMVSEGAAIIDVGGESTRPGHAPVSADHEAARVVPVIEALTARFDAPVSIDTTKASVARAACAAGAAVINDIWGLRADPQMADTVADTESAVIIMHNRNQHAPELDVIADMTGFFKDSLALTQQAGVPDAHVLLDPGIGFGKTLDQNLDAIARLGELRQIGRPILLGLSRKSFIAKVMGAEVNERLPGTLVSNAVGLMQGADVIRVHDVAEHAQACALLRALKALPSCA